MAAPTFLLSRIRIKLVSNRLGFVGARFVLGRFG
jgi:hypothetical protein